MMLIVLTGVDNSNKIVNFSVHSVTLDVSVFFKES